MSVEDIEARRAARKAEAHAQRESQREIDLEAIDALEIERGDSNVAAVEVPHSPGLPAMFAVRTPTSGETKRYRARVKPGREGEPGDYVAAAEELGAVCLVYPDRDTFDRMVAARPGITTQGGLAALKLASGQAEDQGKG